jgi:N,N-dimethylformamidase
VTATLDPEGGATLHARALVNATNGLLDALSAVQAETFAEGRLGTLASSVTAAAGPFLLAAHGGAGGVAGHLNGKLEHPRVIGRVITATERDRITADPSQPVEGTLAEWDFSDEIGPGGVPSLRVSDRSCQGHDGECVNLPSRGMTGHAWDATEERYVHAPEHYGAIHFHEDDVEDPGWEPDLASPRT